MCIVFEHCRCVAALLKILPVLTVMLCESGVCFIRQTGIDRNLRVSIRAGIRLRDRTMHTTLDYKVLRGLASAFCPPFLVRHRAFCFSPPHALCRLQQLPQACLIRSTSVKTPVSGILDIRRLSDFATTKRLAAGAKSTQANLEVLEE